MVAANSQMQPMMTRALRLVIRNLNVQQIAMYLQADIDASREHLMLTCTVGWWLGEWVVCEGGGEGGGVVEGWRVSIVGGDLCYLCINISRISFAVHPCTVK